MQKRESAWITLELRIEWIMVTCSSRKSSFVTCFYFIRSTFLSPFKQQVRISRKKYCLIESERHITASHWARHDLNSWFTSDVCKILVIISCASDSDSWKCSDSDCSWAYRETHKKKLLVFSFNCLLIIWKKWQFSVNWNVWLRCAKSFAESSSDFYFVWDYEFEVFDRW